MCSAAGLPTACSGSLASMITVEPGYEAAIAAALGPRRRRRGAGPRTAAAAVRLLKADDAGRAALLLADASLAGPRAGSADRCRPSDDRRQHDCRTGRAGPRTWSTAAGSPPDAAGLPAGAPLLAGIAVVDDLRTPRRS